MTPYKNISGISGVSEYKLRNNCIKVRFSKPTIYVYDHSKPGRRHVEQMTLLAVAGKGLATYISQNIKENYSRTE